MNMICTPVAALLLFSSAFCVAQNPGSVEQLAEQARREYSVGKFADAERDFREITQRDASNIYAQIYLGQCLFRQEKYEQAIDPYEKAHQLEMAGTKLTSDQHRILIDQLAMSYGINGNLKGARILLEDAIRQDPNYPLNYYNLACVSAEEKDKNKVLKNLSLAFQRKEHVLKGERMPDPRTDSSFENYFTIQTSSR
jgi:tetratricopeptide (TPR) repeat protein